MTRKRAFFLQQLAHMWLHRMLLSLLKCHAFSTGLATKFGEGGIFNLLLKAITQPGYCSVWLTVQSGATFSSNKNEKMHTSCTSTSRHFFSRALMKTDDLCSCSCFFARFDRGRFELWLAGSFICTYCLVFYCLSVSFIDQSECFCS